MLTPKLAIFLCDRSGIAARPWASAGYECWCIDTDHSIRRDRVEQVGAGRIVYAWGDARSWLPPRGHIAFMGAMPPCTHNANSGARDFKKKRGWLLADAIQIFDSCRQVCEFSRAPYWVENPMGRLNTHREPPDYTFDPCDYAGYLPDPAAEAYTKETCLWTGGGFVMPEPKRVIPTLGSLMHLLPPSDDREEVRSRTPAGFALAVFLTNAPVAASREVA